MPTVEISNYGTFAGPGAGDGNSNPVTTFNDNEDMIPFKQMIQTLLLLMNLTSLSV